MARFSLQILVGFTSFEKVAIIYNEEIQNTNKLIDSIEDMFFIYNLKNYVFFSWRTTYSFEKGKF